MAGRFALIIANLNYIDDKLRKLATPEQDAQALEAVLRAPEIGKFDSVQVLIDKAKDDVELTMETFFRNRKPDDLLLIYFSGHGVRDIEGQLYLAVRNTRTVDGGVYISTAIGAQTIAKFMNGSRSRKQVLILDCCHSGAFSDGMKSGSYGVGSKAAFEGDGHGRWVLTATDATQYAWEGNQITGGDTQSVFTRYIIEGLQTGAADVNFDGRITLEELYQYVHNRVVESGAKQTPHKWSYKQEGDVLIATNQRQLKKATDPKKQWKPIWALGIGVIFSAVVGFSIILTMKKTPQYIPAPIYTPESGMRSANNSSVPSNSVAYNDGTDIDRPILAPADENVEDSDGRKWSQLCENHLFSRKLGWARAECDKGLEMSGLEAKVRGSLLYNMGLVYQAAGDIPTTRRYFEQALGTKGITHHQIDVFQRALESVP